MKRHLQPKSNVESTCDVSLPSSEPSLLEEYRASLQANPLPKLYDKYTLKRRRISNISLGSNSSCDNSVNASTTSSDCVLPKFISANRKKKSINFTLGDISLNSNESVARDTSVSTPTVAAPRLFKIPLSKRISLKLDPIDVNDSIPTSEVGDNSLDATYTVQSFGFKGLPNKKLKLDFTLDQTNLSSNGDNSGNEVASPSSSGPLAVAQNTKPTDEQVVRADVIGLCSTVVNKDVESVIKESDVSDIDNREATFTIELPTLGNEVPEARVSCKEQLAPGVEQQSTPASSNNSLALPVNNYEASSQIPCNASFMDHQSSPSVGLQKSLVKESQSAPTATLHTPVPADQSLSTQVEKLEDSVVNKSPPPSQEKLEESFKTTESLPVATVVGKRRSSRISKRASIHKDMSQLTTVVEHTEDIIANTTVTTIMEKQCQPGLSTSSVKEDHQSTSSFTNDVCESSALVKTNSSTDELRQSCPDSTCNKDDASSLALKPQFCVMGRAVNFTLADMSTPSECSHTDLEIDSSISRPIFLKDKPPMAISVQFDANESSHTSKVYANLTGERDSVESEIFGFRKAAQRKISVDLSLSSNASSDVSQELEIHSPQVASAVAQTSQHPQTQGETETDKEALARRKSDVDASEGAESAFDKTEQMLSCALSSENIPSSEPCGGDQTTSDRLNQHNSAATDVQLNVSGSKATSPSFSRVPEDTELSLSLVLDFSNDNNYNSSTVHSSHSSDDVTDQEMSIIQEECNDSEQSEGVSIHGTSTLLESSKISEGAVTAEILELEVSDCINSEPSSVEDVNNSNSDCSIDLTRRETRLSKNLSLGSDNVSIEKELARWSQDKEDSQLAVFPPSSKPSVDPHFAELQKSNLEETVPHVKVNEQSKSACNPNHKEVDKSFELPPTSDISSIKKSEMQRCETSMSDPTIADTTRSSLTIHSSEPANTTRNVTSAGCESNDQITQNSAIISSHGDTPSKDRSGRASFIDVLPTIEINSQVFDQVAECDAKSDSNDGSFCKESTSGPLPSSVMDVVQVENKAGSPQNRRVFEGKTSFICDTSQVTVANGDTISLLSASEPKESMHDFSTSSSSFSNAHEIKRGNINSDSSAAANPLLSHSGLLLAGQKAASEVTQVVAVSNDIVDGPVMNNATICLPSNESKLITFCNNVSFNAENNSIIPNCSGPNNDTIVVQSGLSSKGHFYPPPSNVSQVEPQLDDVSQTEPAPSDISQTEPAPSDVSQTEPVPSDISQTEPAPSDVSQIEPPPSKVLQVDALPSDVVQAEPQPGDTSRVEPPPGNVSQVEPLPNKVLQVDTLPSDLPQAEAQPCDASQVQPLPSNVSQVELPPSKVLQVNTLPSDVLQAEPQPCDASRVQPPPSGISQSEPSSNNVPRKESLPSNVLQAEPPSNYVSRVASPPSDVLLVETLPSDVPRVLPPPNDASRMEPPPCKVAQTDPLPNAVSQTAPSPNNVSQMEPLLSNVLQVEPLPPPYNVSQVELPVSKVPPVDTPLSDVSRVELPPNSHDVHPNVEAEIRVVIPRNVENEGDINLRGERFIDEVAPLKSVEEMELMKKQGDMLKEVIANDQILLRPKRKTVNFKPSPENTYHDAPQYSPLSSQPADDQDHSCDALSVMTTEVSEIQASFRVTRSRKHCSSTPINKTKKTNVSKVQVSENTKLASQSAAPSESQFLVPLLPKMKKKRKQKETSRELSASETESSSVDISGGELLSLSDIPKEDISNKSKWGGVLHSTPIHRPKPTTREKPKRTKLLVSSKSNESHSQRNQSIQTSQKFRSSSKSSSENIENVERSSHQQFQQDISPPKQRSLLRSASIETESLGIGTSHMSQTSSNISKPLSRSTSGRSATQKGSFFDSYYSHRKNKTSSLSKLVESKEDSWVNNVPSTSVGEVTNSSAGGEGYSGLQEVDMNASVSSYSLRSSLRRNTSFSSVSTIYSIEQSKNAVSCLSDNPPISSTRDLLEDELKLAFQPPPKRPNLRGVCHKVSKPIALYKPGKWASREMYDFLTNKLKGTYGLCAKKEAEFIVIELNRSYALAINGHSAPLDELKGAFKQRDVCTNNLEFYSFLNRFMPFEFKVAALPMGGAFGSAKGSRLNLFDPI